MSSWPNLKVLLGEENKCHFKWKKYQLLLVPRSTLVSLQAMRRQNYAFSYFTICDWRRNPSSRVPLTPDSCSDIQACSTWPRRGVQCPLSSPRRTNWRQGESKSATCMSSLPPFTQLVCWLVRLKIPSTGSTRRYTVSIRQLQGSESGGKVRFSLPKS